MVTLLVGPKGEVYWKIKYTELMTDEINLLVGWYRDGDEEAIICPAKSNWEQGIWIALRGQKKESQRAMKQLETQQEPIDIINYLKASELKQEEQP